MPKDITERVLKEGYFIATTGATVRKTAKVFLYSKSTVHNDVTFRLYKLDKELYSKVRIVLETNLAERHIRGGIATKNKYLGIKNFD
jgi:putative DeoR family transcriptional regulator (stage III sporulation protein D)